MPEHDGLMRVFWPVDIARSELPGVVVGWKNSALDVTVVAILEDADVRNVDFALKTGMLFRNSAHNIARIYELCGQPHMHVLGLANAPEDQLTDSSWVRVITTGPDIRGRVPKVTCARASTIQMILYQRPQPHRMQYISIHPVSLALKDRLNDGKVTKGHHGSEKSNGAATGRGHGIEKEHGKSNGGDIKNGTERSRISSSRSSPAAAAAAAVLLSANDIEAEDERQERLRKEKKQNLLNKLRLHSVVKRIPSPKERALPRIVNQINWAWELEQLLQKNVSRMGTRSKRSLSMSERVVESATTMKDIVLRWIWKLIMLYVVPVITRIFVLGLVGHRIAAEMLLCILEWRANPRYAALKDISATAQQVEIRLLQFCYWPMQYVKLRQRGNDWESVTTNHPDYIRFYNSLWLVANDVIIGIALGSYIIDNAGWVADQISMLLSTYTVDALQSSISWLMGWPAGLKLNTELAAFLGDLFLWVIEYWSSCIEALRPALPHIVWFIGFSSFAGASMPLALFSDLLSILTIHIYSFYLASARIYHWQLTILISLFHLFRGKKHNVLRNRIDSCDYDLDQLLVGTILFTFLFFLLPTVVVFYLNFAVARMVIISLKAVFDTLLSCLNHFPLFALMLRIKDPRRLPGGIRFELRDINNYITQTAGSADETAADASSPSHPSTSIIFLTVSCALLPCPLFFWVVPGIILSPVTY